MRKDVDALKRVVFQGNGQPSLVAIVAQTNTKIDELGQVVHILNTNVSALVKFQTKVETEKEVVTKQKKKKTEILNSKAITKRWLIGLVIAIILSLTTCLITLI